MMTSLTSKESLLVNKSFYVIVHTRYEVNSPWKRPTRDKRARLSIRGFIIHSRNYSLSYIIIDTSTLLEKKTAN